MTARQANAWDDVVATHGRLVGSRPVPRTPDKRALADRLVFAGRPATVIATDAVGDYRSFVEVLGGTVLDLRGGSCPLNPFAMPEQIGESR